MTKSSGSFSYWVAGTLLFSLVTGGAMYALAERYSLAEPPRSDTIGGPFRLITVADDTITHADFRGRWMLVYFGYTRCPARQCGVTLSNLEKALTMLGRDARRFAPLMITLDPVYDTPGRLFDYTDRFGPHLIGLTGSPKAIYDVARRYHIPIKGIPVKDAGFTPVPAPRIAIINPKGVYSGFMSVNESATDMLKRLQRLLHRGTPR